MPRAKAARVQFWARALNASETDGQRIIYCEALSELKDCLSLASTHLMDSKVGLAFFDDKTRMHRDLLADAATDILKHMNLPKLLGV